MCVCVCVCVCNKKIEEQSNPNVMDLFMMGNEFITFGKLCFSILFILSDLFP